MYVCTGEWQTQLSRQQKKQAALRQKKQVAIESPVPSKPAATENKGEEEGSKAAANGEKASYSKGGRRGKGKKQRDKDIGKSRDKDVAAGAYIRMCGINYCLCC